jgi:anti-sigma B factor antagonist
MSDSSSITVIRLAGELDIGRRDEIQRAFVIPPSAARVLVDLSEVTYADSTTLAELLRLRADAQAQAARIAIVIGSRRFARVIQYAGLNSAFAIFDDRGSALTYLATGDVP